MPITTDRIPTTMFRGVQSLDSVLSTPERTEERPPPLPSGFDAVVQFDSALLRAQLAGNLQQLGVATLSARVLYSPHGFPGVVRAAVEALLDPLDVPVEVDLELRASNPRLVRLQVPTTDMPPGVVTIDSEFPTDVSAGPGRGPEMQADIEWQLELNLLRFVLDPPRNPATSIGGGTGAPGQGRRSVARVSASGMVMTPAIPTRNPPGTSAVRDRLAVGRITCRVPVRLVSREELLQVWVELDVARAQTSVTSSDSPLTELLAAQRGQDMLREALAQLTSRHGVRLSPQASIAGDASLQQIAQMGLAPMRATMIVRAMPDGRDVLSLCVNLRGEPVGSASQVLPFLQSSQFAYYVKLSTAAPVLQARWKMRPASHEFIGDIPLEMPLEEGSEETGEGRIRLRVRLGATLKTVALMAIESLRDDVLRLGCDQEIQILQAWWANGEDVGDLGDLGRAVAMPFILNNQLFAAPDQDEQTDTPLRSFLRFLIEPLARPLVESFEIARVGGLASEALGAIVVRWSLRPPPPVVVVITDPLAEASSTL